MKVLVGVGHVTWEELRFSFCELVQSMFHHLVARTVGLGRRNISTSVCDNEIKHDEGHCYSFTDNS